MRERTRRHIMLEVLEVRGWSERCLITRGQSSHVPRLPPDDGWRKIYSARSRLTRCVVAGGALEMSDVLSRGRWKGEQTISTQFPRYRGVEEGIGVDGFSSIAAIKCYALWYLPVSYPCHSLLYSSRPPLIQQLGNQYITEYQPIFRPECQPKFVLLHRTPLRASQKIPPEGLQWG
ncbi:unnamed protein product [Onchocerca flexuosa]|uniref:Uncharacterized protein n=1 Tax=Onchocerca flexuosa TaxID=387005 RepID=A0A183I4Z0_9BILA|nr:unnamed protein product [Onchocerca flexuosa]